MMRALDDPRGPDSRFHHIHVCVRVCAAHIPMYLYPFLNTVMSKSRPFEYLRLTSLGVIGALVKVGTATHVTIRRDALDRVEPYGAWL